MNTVSCTCLLQGKLTAILLGGRVEREEGRVRMEVEREEGRVRMEVEKEEGRVGIMEVEREKEEGRVGMEVGGRKGEWWDPEKRRAFCGL